MIISGWWLFIETSGRAANLGIAKDGEMIEIRALAEARRHARDMAATTQSMLNAAGTRLRDISGVVVSRGPGSYTGLRVGMISAQTLAYATGCPLVQVDTFASIAVQTPEPFDRVEIISDAQQEFVYTQSFERDRKTNQWIAMNELRIAAIATWAEGVPDGVPISGTGIATYSSLIPERIVRLPEIFRQPTADGLLAVVRSGSIHAMITPVNEATPLYLRGSSAEEKLKRNGSTA